jgi:hypothetical protein
MPGCEREQPPGLDAAGITDPALREAYDGAGG